MTEQVGPDSYIKRILRSIYFTANYLKNYDIFWFFNFNCYFYNART